LVPIIRNGKEEENEFLLVWTTTPWTIPADTLVAIHPEIKYALVEKEGKKYWLAEKLIKKTFRQKEKIIKTLSGKDLIEKEKITHYKAPFDDLPIIKRVAVHPHFHKVVLAKNLVNEEEGTGLVHIVPGAGTEDYYLVKKELKWNEVIFPVVDEEANYIEGYSFLTNKNAKDHPELVIDYLKKKENGRFLLKIEPYTHSYPTCWRCGTELIWRLVDEWYINMDKKGKDGKNLREKMIGAAKKINWIPKFGRERELDWLKNMHDWLISKKRYWGLALPIWECPKCHHFEVIGGKEELKERAIQGWEKFAGHSPHRPYIDKVKIACPKCGSEMSRIKDVGNPWLDAGIVSFSTLIDPKTGKVSYLDDKKYWRQWFPADLILECFPGQFRNWFYSLIAMASGLENKPPTKTVFGHALVFDEKGEEMHKSKGNAIWFDDAAEKMGVDVMRWLYALQNPEINLNFGYKKADEVRRQFHLLLWNTYRFFVTYYNLLNQRTKKAKPRFSLLDKWIISRLHRLIKETTESLNKYQMMRAAEAIQNFVNDLSLWYVRRSRERLGLQNKNLANQAGCLATLKEVFVTLSKIVAPFIPFLAEEIYQNIENGPSVHLEEWPKANPTLINQKLEEKMTLIREICALGHAARKEKNIKVRQPLNKLLIFLPHQQAEFQSSINKELVNLIKDELNIKEVVFKESGGELKVKLDTKITPKLKAEGEAREIIRAIQDARRKKGFKPEQPAIVYLPSWPRQFEEKIKVHTQTQKLYQGDKLEVKPADGKKKN